MLTRPACLLLAAFVAATAAFNTRADEVLLIPDSNGDRIMLFSPVDGTLLDPDFITDPGTVDGVDIFDRPLNAIVVDGTTILVSDQFSDLVAEFRNTGDFLRIVSNNGNVDTMRLANIRGIDVRVGSVLVTNAGGSNAFATKDNVQRYELLTGAPQPDFAFNQKGGVASPFDVLVLSDRVLIANEGFDNILQFGLDGTFQQVFAFNVDFPQQINLTNDDTLLVAQFGAGFVTEFDLAGNILGNFDTPQTSSYRAAIDLDNGNLLVTTTTGVHEITRTGVFVETEFAGSGMRYIERADLTLPTRGVALAPTVRTSNHIPTPDAPAPDIPVPDAETPDAEQRAAERGMRRSAAEQDHRAVALDRAAPQSSLSPTEFADLVPIAGPALRGATTLAGEKRIYIFEDSGFFGATGVVRGRVAVLAPDNPGNVTLLGRLSELPYNWGGIDFRTPALDSFHAYDNLTNTTRPADINGGQSVIDSTGWIAAGVAGLTFSNDGALAYAAGTSGFFARVVVSDPATAEVLQVVSITGESGINALATVPPGTNLPFPAGEIFALQNSVFGGANLLRLDLDNEVIADSTLVTPVGFTVAFEGGLDFAPDGTLYAAIQGVEQVAPDIFEDRSSRLFEVDPVTGAATLLGVIQAEFTWDVGGLSVFVECPDTYTAANWFELDPCLLGPDATRDPACYCADADGDLDVDLADLAEFQVDFGA